MVESSADGIVTTRLPCGRPAPTCGECGSLIGDVTVHTRFHAGQGDDAQAVADFLSGIDPGELQAAVMGVLDEQPAADPITAALDVLKALAGAR